MQDSQSPNKVKVVWANNAQSQYVTFPVPDASQIGVTNGAASFTDGFPPLNFTALSAGGAGPFGKDFNGLLKQLTSNIQWWNAGGPVTYDAAFSTAVGGYPMGAIVASATVFGRFWICSIDNNTNNPDSNPFGWIGYSLTATLSPEQLFTTIVSSGTYTIVSSAVKITAVGAGGGGAGTNGGSAPAPAGGGAGATLYKYLSGLTPGNTLNINIGSGGLGGGTGSGGSNGGGDTVVSSGSQGISTLIAGGGQGTIGPSGSGGQGGTATGGDINLQGNGGNGGPTTGIGGVAQPYAPFGNGGGTPGNSVVVNGSPLFNQNGAQGLVTIEAIG